MLRISIATIFLAVAPMQALAEKTLAIAGSNTGLFISRDRGVTWEKNAELGDTPIRAVVIERSNLNRLYAATTDALLISADGGTSWSPGRCLNQRPTEGHLSALSAPFRCSIQEEI